MKIRNLSLVMLLAMLSAAGAQDSAKQKQSAAVPMAENAIVIDDAPAELRDVVPRQWTAVFAPDGKTLAVTGGWDNPREPGELALWDVASRKVRLLRRQGTAIRCVAFSADGKFVAIGDFGGQVKVIDPSTGNLIAGLPKHQGIVNSVAFTPDSETVVSSGFDGTIKFWDIAAAKLTQELSVGEEKINSIAIAWHGARLAAATREGNVHVFNLLTRRKLFAIPVSREIVETVVFAPDGKSLATGDWGGQLKLWEAGSGRKVREFKRAENVVENVAFSPDGRILACSAADGNVTFYDPASGENTMSWRAHGGAVFGMGFSPDGKMLATSSFVRGPKIWDLKTPKLSTDLEQVDNARKQDDDRKQDDTKTLLEKLDFGIDVPNGGEALVDQPTTYHLNVVNKSQTPVSNVSMRWSLKDQEAPRGNFPLLSLRPGEKRSLPATVAVRSAGNFILQFHLGDDIIGSAVLNVSAARQKAAEPQPESEVLWIELNQSRLLRMRSGKNIVKADSDDIKVARPWQGDNSGTVQVIGEKLGKTWVTLTDEKGVSETREIRTVEAAPYDPRAVSMLVGQTHSASMKSGRPIFSTFNTNGKVAVTEPTDEAGKFKIKALHPGWAGLTLTDDRGTTEILEIRVVNNPIAVIETSKGRIKVELNAQKAPLSVHNFVRYAGDGFYDGTLFHRVIHSFMIQGGGFTTGLIEKKTREPIKNEWDNGLTNDRGTIAMARLPDIDSATAQFYINVYDNSFLDRAKYAVFGKVIEGMDVVDAIRKVPTGSKGVHMDVPTEEVVIRSIRVLSPGQQGSPSAKPKPPGLVPGKRPLAAVELAARIDELIEMEQVSHGIGPAPLADDAEFMRRLYLDLTGRIPSMTEAREFLDDPIPDRRARLIDRLLDQPRYAEHMGNTWRTLLLPPSTSVAEQLQMAALKPGFKTWLDKRFQDNVGYNNLVRELLTAPTNGGVALQRSRRGGLPDNTPSAAAFYLANENRPERLAASTARIFLGVRLDCAQCHDHPFTDWKRSQFWEYAAFFAPNGSIAIPSSGKVVQGRFLDGTTPPSANAADARTHLVDWMTSPANPYFARTAVNRLWEHLFGIGIIDPVDDEATDDNPASHPVLLAELTAQFVASDHDIKRLIRAIALSKTYQRTSVTTGPRNREHDRLFARMAVKGMSPEQLFDSFALATGYEEMPVLNDQFNGLLPQRTPRTDFLALFAGKERRTETKTTILQMLALMNGKLVADATSLERSKALASILASSPGSSERITLLYLATLSRKPRLEEEARLLIYVDKGDTDAERRAAFTDVFWALLNSPEFFFNH